jgi:enoyl-CoA hydratase/carnithine racemase
MNARPIETKIENTVGIIQFNRPEVHNALDDDAQEQLYQAVITMSEDPAVRVILLCGQGASFCAGRDTRVLGQRDPGDSDFHFVKRAQKVQHAFFDCAKPIIAAMKGAAIGGGFELGLAADIRVVGRSSKMSLPEILFGLLPDMGGTQSLRTMIGRSRTKYLVMTGEKITGEQAYEWGIADWLVDDHEVDQTAKSLAEKIAGNSPLAVQMAKHLIDQVDYGQIKSGLRQELTSISTLFKSDDYREARQALVEKRTPRFTGK